MSTISNYDYQNDASLNDKWKYRFAFFEKHGYPAFWGPSPAWKEAFKGMTFGQKRKVSTNYFAFFFPFIYLFILGLWKKALLVVVLNVVVFVLAVISGVGFLGYLINAIVALRTNTWYYDFKTKGIQDWSF
ncbi:DUF2628 domain-containing protein [Kosakonia oryzendophytica]|uniref:DUF2628 domain-containing protein n=1 Tax=Kosakonia oryzendophytica TaxID=1005665 RepID=UPI003D330B11